MVVIDASVVHKWFSSEGEELVTVALDLLEHHLNDKEPLLAPDFIIYELGNSWATKTKVTISQARKFLKDLEKVKINIEEVNFNLVDSAMKFSKKYGVTVYDASYAVLAKEKRCNLITADEKFVKQVNLPFVEHLSEYSA